MGSRIRENVQHFFECYCEVFKPVCGPPFISKKFPKDYDNTILKTLPDFTYPCCFELSTTQCFSFVLTNIDSKWMYGFCRHDPDVSYALVILSYLPYHDTFYKLLGQLGKLSRDNKKLALETLIVLSDNDEDQCNIADNIEKLLIPLYSSLPSPIQEYKLPKIPENVNLTEYYSAVDTNGMIEILSALLFERRIIIRSRKPSRLAACVQAANDLLYPLVWQHIFIPVLPASLSEYLLAPMPFLIGVPEAVITNIDLSDIGDVVILDADVHVVYSPFNDTNSLPHEAVSILRKVLKGPNLLDDNVSRAFLRTITYLIGSYREAFKFENGQIVFDNETFISSRGSSMKPFLQKLVSAQTFQQFIEERIELARTGTTRTDEFEREHCIYESNGKFGNSSHTFSNKLTDTLHFPSKIFRQVRDKIRNKNVSTVNAIKWKTPKNNENKTNPVVESAVESMRSGRRGVRSAYKDLRTRLENISFRSDSSPRGARSRSGSRPMGRHSSNFEIIEELGSPSNSEKLSQSCNLETNSYFTKNNDQFIPLKSHDNAEALPPFVSPIKRKDRQLTGLGSPPSPLSPLFPDTDLMDKEIGDLIKLCDEPLGHPSHSSIPPSDVDLLQEYGLDVNRFRLSRGNWMTFE